MSNVNDQEKRNEEMLALKSIFDNEMKMGSDNTASIPVSLKVPHANLAVQYIFYINRNYLDFKSSIVSTASSTKNLPSSSTSTKEPAPNANRIILTHLPPINLLFTLPEDYPSSKPPSIYLDCIWLSVFHIQLLYKKIWDIWHELHDSCIYNIIDFIQEDGWRFLEFDDNNNDSSSTGTLKVYAFWFLNQNRILKEHEKKEDVSDAPSSSNKERVSSSNISNAEIRAARSHLKAVKKKMLEYNRKQVLKVFNQETHFCGICLEEKKGVESFQLVECKHVYCLDCLRGYFKVLLSENAVGSIKCPHAECSKNSSLMSRAELEDLFNGEGTKPEGCGGSFLDTYDIAYKKYLLDTRLDIVQCPREACADIVEVGDEDSKVLVCATCGFAFCKKCRQNWHGPSVKCKKLEQIIDDRDVTVSTNTKSNRISLRELAAMVDSYRFSLNANERMNIENKMGGKESFKNLMKLVDDERESAKWIQSNTRMCPCCETSVEKTMGCNHMTCAVCWTHWCWLCGAYLHDNPYNHFNDKDGKCFQKLFDEAEADDLFVMRMEHGRAFDEELIDIGEYYIDVE